MRVITGIARGRRLRELSGREIRPTTEKVKEALFSALQFEIEGRCVLDLFAGTGQLGIEALSRGAARCTFVDRRGDAVKLIRANLEACVLSDRARVVCADALEYLEAAGRSGERYGLVFLDPPYAADLLERAVSSMIAFDILEKNGIICAEYPVEKSPPPVGAHCTQRVYRHGKIGLAIYRRTKEETT